MPTTTKKRRGPAKAPVAANKAQLKAEKALDAKRGAEAASVDQEIITGKPARETKQAKVLAMLQDEKGATVAEIMEVTGWKPHTVRAFISTRQKAGLQVTSTKSSTGDGWERTYRVSALLPA